MPELRQDLISREWIIMAPTRGIRPHDRVIGQPKARIPTSKKECPFENLETSGNIPIIRAYPNEHNWRVALIPNKYPALSYHRPCPLILRKGIYAVMDGVGRHELVITRDHTKTIAALSPQDALRVFLLLQEHYRELAKDPCLMYTSTFFNWGVSAGATFYHPHYQVITLPIIPPRVQKSLDGSARYFTMHKRCVHCDLIRHEEKEKKRIVLANREAIAFVPFVSQESYAVTVLPRKHFPVFQNTPKEVTFAVVRTLQGVLKNITQRLRDPDLNFFIHTAPLIHLSRFSHYHWHIEVIPKIAVDAGFEQSTGVHINAVDPDDAARRIRG